MFVVSITSLSLIPYIVCKVTVFFLFNKVFNEKTSNGARSSSFSSDIPHHKKSEKITLST